MKITDFFRKREEAIGEQQFEIQLLKSALDWVSEIGEIQVIRRHNEPFYDVVYFFESELRVCRTGETEAYNAVIVGMMADNDISRNRFVETENGLTRRR